MRVAPKTKQSRGASAKPAAETPAFHTMTAEAATTRLRVDSTSGLSKAEADRRLAQFGPNRLREAKGESLLSVFLEEIHEPMIILLWITGILYAVWAELTDAITIFIIIITLVAVEAVNEHRADRAITALRELAEPTALIRRGGQAQELPVEAVVPGDVALLQLGRRIPADARLIDAYGLAVDESALTGESLPVEKEADLTMPEGTALSERRNLVFAGTTVTRGRGTGVIIATGMTTELGRVAGLTREVEAPPTPMQKAMKDLTFKLVGVALLFSILVPLLGIRIAGQDPQTMLLTGLSLAFFTIPEELPIIVTMVLGLGAYRLSKRHAIAKELRAVETLGAVTAIATDKTGTLTQNRMEAARFYPETQTHKLLEIGVLCNDAAQTGLKVSGDPLEIALIGAAQKAGIDVAALRTRYHMRSEFTFDNTRKRMSTIYDRDGKLWIGVKGAPEAILEKAERQQSAAGEQSLDKGTKQEILDAVAEMAADGMRVIAFAEKTVVDGKIRALSQDAAEANITFIGLVGLADPPRPEAKEAIAACRMAGIRPIMVTGDHPLTAKAIAAQIGMDGDGQQMTGPELDKLSDRELKKVVEDVSLYARATPEHKLRIVRALQARGERVAVTGDGINDAPALAAADIGVAMGQTGTDVARSAASIVLADDNFSTIVHAIGEGRKLFANLKKAVRYYLACKVALIAVALLPVLFLIPIPFAPTQIILMELFMDLAASATFVAERAESDFMHQPPRDPKARFMNRGMVGSIIGAAIGLFAAVTFVYLLAWQSGAGLDPLLRREHAQAVAFVTWLVGHIFLAFNLRSDREPLFRLGVASNRVMVGWAGATALFVLVVTFVPWVQGILKTVPLTGFEWLLILAVAFVCTFWIEAGKWLLPRTASTR
jgi:Ca2+-transporting ATPase